MVGKVRVVVSGSRTVLGDRDDVVGRGSLCVAQIQLRAARTLRVPASNGVVTGAGVRVSPIDEATAFQERALEMEHVTDSVLRNLGQNTLFVSHRHRFIALRPQPAETVVLKPRQRWNPLVC